MVTVNSILPALLVVTSCRHAIGQDNLRVPDIPSVESFQEAACLNEAMYYVFGIEVDEVEYPPEGAAAMDRCPTYDFDLLWSAETQESVNVLIVASHSSNTIYLAFLGLVGGTAFFGPDAVYTTGLKVVTIGGTQYGRINGEIANRIEAAKDLIVLQVGSAMAAHEGYSFVITGHSLGGAEALAIGSWAAVENFFPIEPPVVVKTFGAPRLGDMDYKTAVDDFDNLEIWRMVYEDDWVPRQPDRVLTSYEHAGHLLLQRGTKITAYFRQDGVSGVFGGPTNDQWNGANIPDHRPSSYIDGLNSLTQWPTEFQPFDEPPPSRCFSGVNTVQVEGKGVIYMEDLQVGDHVLTMAGHYSRVYSMAHMDKHSEIDFYQVSFEATDSVLEVTGDHLVFVDDGGHAAIPAHQLQPGHSVRDQNSTLIVSDITMIKRTGLYGPLTEDGHLLVSNVLVSSYVKMFDSYFLLDDHTFSHGLLAPLRIWYRFASTDDETHTQEGISHRVWPLLRLALWMKERQSPCLLHMFTSVVCFPLVGIFWVSERLSLLVLRFGFK